MGLRAAGCRHATWLGADSTVVRVLTARRGRAQTASRSSPHDAVPVGQAAMEGHLERHRPARHGERRLRRQGSVRAARPSITRAAQRRSRRAALRSGPLYDLTAYDDMFAVRLRRAGAGHGAQSDGLLRRAGRRERSPRGSSTNPPRQCRGAGRDLALAEVGSARRAPSCFIA